MGENSKIEWTDHTFNPWVGCAKVSPACDHCYAESWAKRTGSPALWNGERRRTSEQNWKQPLKWNAEAEKAGTRSRVFCASLADVFDNQVPPEWRTDLFQLILATPSLDWLILTKRPQNIKEMYAVKWLAAPPENVWLGTTVENQTEANRRIPHLLTAPAKMHFLSCEPLLGPVDLTAVKQTVSPGYFGDCLQWHHQPACDKHITYPTINWIICGGESGSKDSRPMHPDWARSLRDQCVAADVPFFFKQWGDWAPQQAFDGHYDHHAGNRCHAFDAAGQIPPETLLWRVGKKNAGRMLDGRTWDEVPL